MAEWGCQTKGDTIEQHTEPPIVLISPPTPTSLDNNRSQLHGKDPLTVLAWMPKEQRAKPQHTLPTMKLTLHICDNYHYKM
ncbi:Hypothetical predicted protein [Pelobates cultripes]|uniref:Uncharacterized protein n=1 Tax=Pelobates cultripes TaxID=61616 RepID=A0AAD1W4Q5_PELCU|nr:Hypothetical predicted protein [Pelobates cultripes]